MVLCLTLWPNGRKSLTSKTGFRYYSQSGRTTLDPTPGRGLRSDCSQWLRAVYMKAGTPDPGTYTGAQMQRGHPTKHPKAGDILINAAHVELYIGDGKTIGHGSPPIDHNTVAWCKGRGMRFYTFSFLD